MNGRASPVGRRIQTNGTRNEKASRLSRDKTTRARKQSTTRTAEGGHPDSERERERGIPHSPVRILSPRPPPHLPARLLARPTTAVGAADRGGQDQRCVVCPFREVDPCSSLRRFIFRGEFFHGFLFWVKDWVSSGGREGGERF